MGRLKKIILKNSILGLLIVLCRCVSGPKNDGRTFAEKMSGENYESTNVVMGVPILKRKPVLRKFLGQVFCGEGVTQTPANHASVRLVSENQTISSTSTDPMGGYIISAPINPENSYKLNATSYCGSASKSLPRESKEQPVEENFYLRK